MPILKLSEKTKLTFKIITFILTLAFMVFVLSPLSDIYPTDEERVTYQTGIDMTVLDKYESLITNESLKDITPFKNATLETLDGPQEIWNSRPGIAVLDYDRDGDQDFFVSNGYGHSNWLYQNDGKGNFIEVGKEAGVSLKNRNNTGVVACDFDNNGYQDLYVGAQGSLTDGLDFRSIIEADQNKDSLLINNGNGTFTDISNTAFSDNINIRSAMTIACSDINSDGWVDIYVGNLGEDEYRKMSVPYQAGHYNMMYLNNGDLTFTEIGEEAGVRGSEIKLLDLDGIPITYTDPNSNITYEAYNPEQKDRNGNLVGDPTGQTHSVLFFDYDNDGDQDLWVANDGDRLHIYRNDSTKNQITFTSVADKMNLDTVGAWMGFAIGDYDSDSDIDVFITNLGFHPRAYRPSQDPKPDCSYFDQFEWGTCLHFMLNNNSDSNTQITSENIFSESSEIINVYPSKLMPPISLDPDSIHKEQKQPLGLSAYDFGFGATFFDFDNDADQDLYYLGSTVDRGEGPGGHIFPGAGRMFENIKPNLFRDITIEAQVLDVDRARYHKLDPNDIYKDISLHRISPLYHENGKGVVHIDTNNDGYLDLIGSNSKGALWEDERQVSFIETGGPIFTWINPGGDNNWIKIQLIGQMAISGTGSNADGIGSKIYVTTGNKKQIQEIHAGSSYLSMDSLKVEFGLGSATKIDMLEIFWPSGKYQKIKNITSNQTIKVTEPK